MDVDRLTMKRLAVDLVATTRTLVGSFIERSESDSDECGERREERHFGMVGVSHQPPHTLK
eukprot:scaffold642_cov75-Cyclotella_meneghiniana.AAC.7